MKKLYIIVFSIFLFNINLSQAQKFYTRNFGINDGLPSNTINDIFRDKRGFLWIATDAGLSRFNGTSFFNYTSQSGLIGDNIKSICEGENGEIWIAAYNSGLNQLKGDIIKSYNTNSGIISNSITKLYYSKEFETLFIGTELGLTTYNKQSGFKSHHKKQNNTKQRLQITNFLEKNEQVYIFTNGSGVYKYLTETEEIIKLPFGNILVDNSINSVFTGNYNKDTLIHYDRINLEIISNGKSQILERFGPISDFAQDLDSNIWISISNNSYWNTGGIYRYSEHGLENFTNNLNINTNSISCLEFDRTENILWIGTQDQGVHLYPLTNFAYFSPIDFNLGNYNIVDIDIINSNLFITSKNGIIIRKDSISNFISITDLNNTFESYKKKHFPLKYQYLIDKEGSFEKYQKLINQGKYPYSNPYIRIVDNVQKIISANSLYKPLKHDVITNKKLTQLTGIFSDNDKNIWIGSNVGVFKLKNTKYEFYDLESNFFSSYIVDQNNNFLCSSWDELFIYPNLIENSTYSVLNHIDHDSPIHVKRTKTQGNKTWFLSSDHGAYVYSNNKPLNTFRIEGLDNVSFNDICFDNSNNAILAGTNGTAYILENTNGLYKIKYELSSKNGLSGTSIRWLQCSTNNLLILGTNAGLNIVNLEQVYQNKNIDINLYDKNSGFIDYAGNTSTIDENNDLWIGSNQYVTKVNLDKLNNKRTQLRNIYIKKIDVNNIPYNLSQIENKDIWTNVPQSSIKLAYNKNSITFYVDVLQYLSPNQISFSYKLEGTNRDWSEKSKEKKIIFQNLKPKNYRLRIKAFYNNSINSNQELSVSFIIEKPFWSKWYSIVSASIILALIIWLIIYSRTRTIKKRERVRSEISERITEFEMKALRAQMNPHFIFNAINSIQNFMLDNNVDEALNYLSDFAKLIRLTLDNVSKKKISLDDELEYLKYYLSLEKMRFDKKFDIQVILPDELSYSKIEIPPMIIQPYIENSIKHGFSQKSNGAKIIVKFEIVNEEFLVCTVEDNGIGRTKSKELNKNNKTHKSKGSFITNERLELLNQTQEKKGYKAVTIDLYNDFNIAIGTKVRIQIPI